jgi:hypothetical protein
VLQIGPCNTCGFNAAVGEVRNNILLGGSAASRYGVYEDAPAGKDQHPKIFEYNLIFISQPTAADHLYRFYDAINGESFLDTVAEVNDLQNLAQRTTLSGHTVVDNPALDGTFHLSTGSPAVDAGTATDAPVNDMDGEPRPQGVAHDIGADEAE